MGWIVIVNPRGFGQVETPIFGSRKEELEFVQAESDGKFSSDDKKQAAIPYIHNHPRLETRTNFSNTNDVIPSGTHLIIHLASALKTAIPAGTVCARVLTPLEPSTGESSEDCTNKLGDRDVTTSPESTSGVLPIVSDSLNCDPAEIAALKINCSICQKILKEDFYAHAIIEDNQIEFDHYFHSSCLLKYIKTCSREFGEPIPCPTCFRPIANLEFLTRMISLENSSK